MNFPLISLCPFDLILCLVLLSFLLIPHHVNLTSHPFTIFSSLFSCPFLLSYHINLSSHHYFYFSFLFFLVLSVPLPLSLIFHHINLSSHHYFYFSFLIFSSFPFHFPFPHFSPHHYFHFSFFIFLSFPFHSPLSSFLNMSTSHHIIISTFPSLFSCASRSTSSFPPSFGLQCFNSSLIRYHFLLKPHLDLSAFLLFPFSFIIFHFRSSQVLFSLVFFFSFTVNRNAF